MAQEELEFDHAILKRGADIDEVFYAINFDHMKNTHELCELFLNGSISFKRSLLLLKIVDINEYYKYYSIPLFTAMLCNDSITKEHLELCDIFKADYTLKHRGKNCDVLQTVVKEVLCDWLEGYGDDEERDRASSSINMLTDLLLSKPEFDPMPMLKSIQEWIKCKRFYSKYRDQYLIYNTYTAVLFNVQKRICAAIIKRSEEIGRILRNFKDIPNFILEDIVLRSVLSCEPPLPKLKENIIEVLNKL